MLIMKEASLIKDSPKTYSLKSALREVYAGYGKRAGEPERESAKE